MAKKTKQKTKNKLVQILEQLCENEMKIGWQWMNSNSKDNKEKTHFRAQNRMVSMHLECCITMQYLPPFHIFLLLR